MGDLVNALHPGGVLRVRPFPDLTVATPRLLIRPLAPDDAAAVDEIFADRQTRRWLALPPESSPVDGASWCTTLAGERQASGDGAHHGVVRREDNRLVGCLWAKHTDWAARSTDVSFAVSPASRGFGIAAEALDAVCVTLILEHGMQRVELRVVPGNTAARRVAEKAGFVYEGLLRNAGHVQSGRVDLEMWSLVAADLR
jgi:ribosomal-protein-alanine N-acetyltransferase